MANDNMFFKQGLSSEQLMMIQAEMENKKKSKVIGYVLWAFLGSIGAHRFYNGNIIQGIAMFLTLGCLGVWTLIDVFFIGKAIEKRNEEIEKQLILEAKMLQQPDPNADLKPEMN